MSVKRIIQESLNKNPLGVKEALAEELRVRVAEALAAKMEEIELDEAFKAGDKVHWEDPDSGKRLTGTVHMAKGSRKGVARVKADGTHGSVWDVHHSHLNKMDEEVDLDEAIHRAGDRVTWRDHSSGKNMTGTVHNASGGRMKGGSLAVVKVDGTHIGSTAKIPHKQLSKIDEDFEQLDEISMEKLKGYYQAAKSDADERRTKHVKGKGEKGNLKKFLKRRAGMDLALRKAGKKVMGESSDLSDYTVEELEDFMMSEEFEQLDELDKKTLASYVKKAAGVAHRNTLPNAMRDRMTAASIGDKEWYKQSGRVADNRSKGIQRAADKLAK